MRTPVFEGPLAELLELAGAQRLDLWALSLLELVEGYRDHSAGVLDLEAATEVTVVVAALLALKCRRLLPKAEDDTGGDLDPSGDRDLLLAALVEGATFSRAGRALGSLADAAALSRPRFGGSDPRLDGLSPNLLAAVRPEDLARACLRALSSPPPPRVDRSHIAAPVLSVEDAAEELAQRLVRAGSASFASLCEGRSAPDVVAWFLAALELYRRELLDLRQDDPAGELVLVWTAGG